LTALLPLPIAFGPPIRLGADEETGRSDDL